MQGIKKRDIYLGFLVVAIIVGMMYAYNRDQKRYEKEIRDLQVRLAQAEEHPDTFFIHDSNLLFIHQFHVFIFLSFLNKNLIFHTPLNDQRFAYVLFL